MKPTQRHTESPVFELYLPILSFMDLHEYNAMAREHNKKVNAMAKEWHFSKANSHNALVEALREAIELIQTLEYAGAPVSENNYKKFVQALQSVESEAV